MILCMQVCSYFLLGHIICTEGHTGFPCSVRKCKAEIERVDLAGEDQRGGKVKGRGAFLLLVPTVMKGLSKHGVLRISPRY